MRMVIVANGAAPAAETVQHWLRPGDRLMCADGGARHALAWGLRPESVVGDMDSLDEADRAQLEAMGTRMIVHPSAKDETDLELALLQAAREGAAEIIVLGGLGGRLDQTIANVLLLTLPQLQGIPTRLVDGEQQAFLIRGQAKIPGHPGDTLSLIPLGGEAEGITTAGLLYPLRDETLRPGPARGVSNVFTADAARVTVRRGSLLAIHITAESQ